MANTSYLIDSSVWIRGLALKASDVLLAPLRALLESGHIVVTDMVRLEVLAGARSSKEFEQFRQDFDAIPCLATTTPVWRHAEELSCSLSRRGLYLPSPDVLIAAAAVVYNVPLWHADSDFERIKRALPELHTFWFPHQVPPIAS